MDARRTLSARLSATRLKITILWVKKHAMQRLFLVIAREICRYLDDQPFIARLRKDTIHILDVRKKQWTETALTRTIWSSSASRYIVIDDHRLIYCGGITPKEKSSDMRRRAWRSTYLVFGSGQVEVLVPMATPRGWHGLVLFHQSVYALGGVFCWTNVYHHPLRSSEVLSLIAWKWSPGLDLKTPRASFYPCVWNDRIFICGGTTISASNIPESVEVVSPSDGISYEYPVPTQSISTTTVWANDGGLVVRTNGRLLIATETAMGLKWKVGDAGACSIQSRMAPVVFEETVYVTVSKKCYGFDCQTGEMRIIA